MIVYLDQGNTRAKWSIELEGQLVSSGYDLSADLKSLGECLGRHAKQGEAFSAAVVSNVKGDAFFSELERALQAYGFNQIAQVGVCKQLGDLGVSSSYQATLGVDRWLMMLAIWEQYQSASLIVSAGTALTMDVIGSDGKHLGGWIAPGLAALRSSLSSNTAEIGYVEGSGDVSLALGNSTLECVQRGCMSMFMGFVASAMRVYGAQVDRKIVCGGDAAKIMECFPGEFNVRESLVIDGLRAYRRLKSF